MRADGHRFQQRPASSATTGVTGPQQRAVLEARWQERLKEVITLSVAYHDAASTPAGNSENRKGRGRGRQQWLLDRAVAARRALADTEQALDRLSAGSYGRCEQCATVIPEHHLAAAPEARYCPGCAPEGSPANDRRLPSRARGEGGDPARRARREPASAGVPARAGPARRLRLVR